MRENAAFDRDFVLSFVFNGKVEHYHIIENPQAPWVYSLDRGPPMDGMCGSLSVPSQGGSCLA